MPIKVSWAQASAMPISNKNYVRQITAYKLGWQTAYGISLRYWNQLRKQLLIPNNHLDRVDAYLGSKLKIKIHACIINKYKRNWLKWIYMLEHWWNQGCSLSHRPKLQADNSLPVLEFIWSFLYLVFSPIEIEKSVEPWSLAKSHKLKCGGQALKSFE